MSTDSRHREGSPQSHRHTGSAASPSTGADRVWRCHALWRASAAVVRPVCAVEPAARRRDLGSTAVYWYLFTPALPGAAGGEAPASRACSGELQEVCGGQNAPRTERERGITGAMPVVAMSAAREASVGRSRGEMDGILTVRACAIAQLSSSSSSCESLSRGLCSRRVRKSAKQPCSTDTYSHRLVRTRNVPKRSKLTNTIFFESQWNDSSSSFLPALLGVTRVGCRCKKCRFKGHERRGWQG
jgi:hypothetical protein